MALGSATSALGIPLAFINTPLTRNGYALVASTLATSVLGFAFWVFATHLYTAEEIGIGGALISSLMMLGNIAQLNFGNLLNRFLPEAGQSARAFVLYAYGAGSLAAVVVACSFMAIVHFFVPSLSFISDRSLISMWFAVSVVMWTIFALQDGVLVGLRRSIWVPFENTAYAISKIALLFLFASTALAGELALLGAWTIPLVVTAGVVNFLIFTRVLPLSRENISHSKAFDPHQVAKFFGWDYVGTLARMIASGLAPVLVLRIVGPSANANYHVSFTIAYSLYLISRSMGASLLTEGARDPSRLRSLTDDALVHTVVPVGLVAAIVFVAAPEIMSVFGPGYAESGSSLLRMLALSSVPWGIITIFLAVARVEGRVRTVAIVETVTLVLVLGLGVALLPRIGELGMGVAWLGAHTAVAIGIAASVVVREGPAHAADCMLRLASSLARTTLPLRSYRSPKRTTLEHSILDSLLAQVPEPEAPTWRLMGMLPSRSDVSVFYVGTPAPGRRVFDTQAPEGTKALLKLTRSPSGVRSLDSHHQHLRELHDDLRLSGRDFMIPTVLATRRTAESLSLLETLLPGQTGTTILQGDAHRIATLHAAARAADQLHNSTCKISTIDDRWLRHWIDEPVALLYRPIATLMSLSERRSALDLFKKEQYNFWHGLTLSLGRAHGDYSPGNILFDAGMGSDREDLANPCRPGVAKVAGLTDWDWSRSDAPSGFDTCLLALTTRMLTTGEELGHIVRSLLLLPKWSGAEESWLSCTAGPGGWPSNPIAVRAMVGLAWAHQLACNIEKSHRYAGSRLWSSVNLERVLQTMRFDPVNRPDEES